MLKLQTNHISFTFYTFSPQIDTCIHVYWGWLPFLFGNDMFPSGIDRTQLTQDVELNTPNNMDSVLVQCSNSQGIAQPGYWLCPTLGVPGGRILPPLLCVSPARGIPSKLAKEPRLRTWQIYWISRIPQVILGSFQSGLAPVKKLGSDENPLSPGLRVTVTGELTWSYELIWMPPTDWHTEFTM